MKIKTLVLIFCYLGIIILSTAGINHIGTYYHEYSHYNDMHYLATEDNICIMKIDEPTGNIFKDYLFSHGEYYMNYEENDTQRLELASKNTEFRAYSIDALLVIAFTLMLLFILIDYMLIKIKINFLEKNNEIPELPNL